jgi:Cu2+-containing amine oxidase
MRVTRRNGLTAERIHRFLGSASWSQARAKAQLRKAVARDRPSVAPASYHIWVTPYREDERYGAGDYPNQSTGGDGLVRWTEQDRRIENTDVVLWYTFSHVHVPRPEDYPVMPTAYIGFVLKPAGFFAVNPALDVAPSQKQSAAGGGCCH